MKNNYELNDGCRIEVHPLGNGKFTIVKRNNYGRIINLRRKMNIQFVIEYLHNEGVE